MRNKNRDVPSRAALPVIRLATGRQQSVSDRAKMAMQGYLNHFLGNMDIANCREINQIVDPVGDATYKDIWMATAKTNTTIYQDVFACIPNDLIRSRAAIRQSMGYWNEKLGHTTIDLGMAPKVLESLPKW